MKTTMDLDAATFQTSWWMPTILAGDDRLTLAILY
jgi:hypothetical protein